MSQAEMDPGIRERLKLLAGYVQDLRGFQDVDESHYASDKMLRRAVERTLHLAIEACLDIGQRIIVCRRFRAPADNKGVFEVLAEEHVLGPHLAARLVAMAGFRNIIVHDYARIDDRIVLGALKKRVGDLAEFAQTVLRFIQVS